MVHLVPLAFLDLPDPPDRAACLTEQTLWVPALTIWTQTLNSSGVLLVHRGLQDHLDPLDPTTHHPAPLMASLLGLLEPPAGMGSKDIQEYQVRQEEMALQDLQDLRAGRGNKDFQDLQDQRENVELWGPQGFPDPRGPPVHPAGEAKQVRRALQDHQDLRGQSSS